MGRNQYVASIHDTAIVCPEPNCGVKNAPESASEYESGCWRCGVDLESSALSVGDIVEVRTIDESESGNTVTKAASGLVVFVTAPVTNVEFFVEITDIDRNCAYGTPTDDVVDEESSDTTTEQSQRLGSRDNFWES